MIRRSFSTELAFHLFDVFGIPQKAYGGLRDYAFSVPHVLFFWIAVVGYIRCEYIGLVGNAPAIFRAIKVFDSLRVGDHFANTSQLRKCHITLAVSGALL